MVLDRGRPMDRRRSDVATGRAVGPHLKKGTNGLVVPIEGPCLVVPRPDLRG
jgi:hypothetical protein